MFGFLKDKLKQAVGVFSKKVEEEVDEPQKQVSDSLSVEPIEEVKEQENEKLEEQSS